MFPFKVHDVGSRTGPASRTGKAHPGRPGKVTTRTRAHSPDAEDASADHHALVRKYLRDVQEMNGKHPSPDRPYHDDQRTPHPHRP